MKSNLQYIDIGGVRYSVDPGKISIDEWLELMLLIEQNRKEEAGIKLVQMAVKALGPAARSLSIVYLPLLIPRVMEVLTKSIMPADLDTEIDEILNRKPPTEG
jgi:hypothetical protein